MTFCEEKLNDHIIYCKDSIYYAYIDLNVIDENTFNLLKSEAINEAMDDIKSEPYFWEEYDVDVVMNLAIKHITFDEYMECRNTWNE